MKVIGFVKLSSMQVQSGREKVLIRPSAVMQFPDAQADELLAKVPAACDLTASRLSQAMFGEPFVPTAMVWR